MDKAIRNMLQRTTQAARRLLEDEFQEQLEGTFDILLDGRIAGAPGEHLSSAEQVVREKLLAVIAHKLTAGLTPGEAVAAYLREAAFTALNRFVALKMLEARGLVQECVSKGEESAGFKELFLLAPGLVSIPDKGYRLYIESLFDEIGQEVRVLFDRRDVASLLWPRHQALLELLERLNDFELAEVWGEDETIGWVYQYFNGDDERKKMRDESQAPRNSRELAVRNQFFTPRYVVQFLTDNTLGRTWYEMRHGDTRLAKLDYLVRRKNEVFLEEGVLIPESDSAESDDAETETTFVPYRAPKDPRELRILDPACGSGHFLLYAFDLLLSIYEEAWQADIGTIRDDFGTMEALRLQLPSLILEHNLHGVDIDPRAAQIAALALWMRAQRAYNDFSVTPEDRRAIKKTNIVVAEPMPGDADMVNEFAATLHPPVLGDLFKKMVTEMRLAGELGSLLKIEESISEAVRKARQEFVKERQQRKEFLPGLAPERRQQELDLSGIDDEHFFEDAEERIVQALERFTQAPSGGGGIRRQLFAGDSAQGVAFIELMRKKYDVALMNPPFGEPTSTSSSYLQSHYTDTRRELSAAMVERLLLSLERSGQCGAISTRAPFFLSSYESWRTKYVFGSASLLTTFADLGSGVLDAMVETCAYTLVKLDRLSSDVRCLAVKVVDTPDKDAELRAAVSCYQRRQGRPDMYEVSFSHLLRIPTSPFAYWAHQEVLELFSKLEPLCTQGRIARTTNPTTNDFRFSRCWWEVPNNDLERKWKSWNKGGGYSPFFRDYTLVVDWDIERQTYSGYTGTSYRPDVRPANLEYFFRPGLTWVYRGHRLCVQAMPSGTAISTRGNGIYSKEEICSFDLGLLNTAVADYLVKLSLGRSDHPQFDIGDVSSIPMPQFDPRIAEIATEAAGIVRASYQNAEESRSFQAPALLDPRVSRGTEDLSLFGAYQSLVQSRREQLQALAEELESRAFDLYQLPTRLLGELVSSQPADPAAGMHIEDDPHRAMAAVVSWAVGVVFGRFDKTASASQLALPDPFSPLPRPKMVTTENPRSKTYGAIVVEDSGHPSDICIRVSGVLAELVRIGDTDSLASILMSPSDTASLRDWMKSQFFTFHISVYQAARRKAPIYWQLATPSASYSVWLFYHLFTKDTLFRALNEYVDPKLKYEESKLAQMRQDFGLELSTSQRKELEAQETFVEELSGFRQELARVAPLWNPDLNDGVIINFAPLWRLVPQHRQWQKECRKVWDKLVTGDYDWAHLAMHLWPERVVPKCLDDRSLAIAHGLEDEFWNENDNGKWHQRQVDDATAERLIGERTSTAVNAALDDLLSAPALATGGTRRTRGRKTKSAAPKQRTTLFREETKAKSAPTPTVDDNVLDSVRKAISQVAGGASRADVLAASGLSDGEWNRAIAALLERGDVTRTGQKRGTKYHASERNGGTNA